MGFRSTLISQNNAVAWPDWIKEKYKATLEFRPSPDSIIHSRGEFKADLAWDALPEDIRQVLDTTWSDVEVVLVMLHECDGVTRVRINRRGVEYSEPVSWRLTEGVTHNYCNRCSEPRNTSVKFVNAIQ